MDANTKGRPNSTQGAVTFAPGTRTYRQKGNSLQVTLPFLQVPIPMTLMLLAFLGDFHRLPSSCIQLTLPLVQRELERDPSGRIKGPDLEPVGEPQRYSYTRGMFKRG